MGEPVAEISPDEWFGVRDTVRRLGTEVFGENGKMGLEDRMIAYIDSRDDHTKRNAAQALLDFGTLMNAKHTENKAVQDDHGNKLTNIIATVNRMEGGWALAKVMAAFIAFMVTAIFALLMYLATTRQHAGIAGTNPTVAQTTADSR